MTQNNSKKTVEFERLENLFLALYVEVCQKSQDRYSENASMASLKLHEEEEYLHSLATVSGFHSAPIGSEKYSIAQEKLTTPYQDVNMGAHRILASACLASAIYFSKKLKEDDLVVRNSPESRKALIDRIKENEDDVKVIERLVESANTKRLHASVNVNIIDHKL